MKSLMLIVGIVSYIACVLSLLSALLHWWGYSHLRDGSSGHYRRLHRRGILFLATGIGLAAIGTVCLIFRINM